MQCPQCQGHKVQKIGKALFFFVGLGTVSIFFWIGLLIPFLWVGMAAGALLMIISLFAKPMYHCKDCSHNFKVAT